MVNSDKWDKLAEWMEKLHINEDSLIEKFIIGSGKGERKLLNLVPLGSDTIDMPLI
jgi:hypothetical protein